MTSQLTLNPAGILGSLADIWTRYRRRRAAIAELHALGHTELQRMVQDAGLTYGDLMALTKKDGDSASLMYRRLDESGIDARTIDTAVLRDMQRCCTFCTAKAQCAHELEDRPKAASWPDYCPNQHTVEALGQAKCH